MNAIYTDNGIWYIQKDGDSTLYTPIAGSCSKKQDGTLISISNSPNINFSGSGDIFNKIEVTTIAKNSVGDTFESLEDFNSLTKDFFIKDSGGSTGSGTLTVTSFSATASQQVFTVTDASIKIVTKNGVVMTPGVDYTGQDSASITFEYALDEYTSVLIISI